MAEAHEAIAEAAHAGRPGEGGAGAPSSGSTGNYGGHSGRPRNMVDFERQDRWVNAAYDDIRANPDAEVIAGSLSDVERLDGSTGFSPDEIERVRQHVFFEEHPLSDYDGGVVHQRYDASADMAEAWLRLRSGDPRPEDIALLDSGLTGNSIAC